MKAFQKKSVSIAAPNRSKFAMPSNHITTMNFGECVPVYNLECIPGDKIKLKPSVFARMASLALPTYADVRLKFKAFFVPYDNFWSHFNEFITGLPSYIESEQYYISSAPIIYESEIRDIFLTESVQENLIYTATTKTLMIELTHAEGYDIVSDSQHFYRLTPRGKYFLKFLESLGYNVNFNDNSQGVAFSALPILAFFKMWLDWFIPSQYQSVSLIHSFMSQLNSMANPEITGDQLLDLFMEVVLTYENDYFTSAWPQLNSSSDALTVGNAAEFYTGPDLPTFNATHANNNQTYISPAGTNNTISQLGLDILKRLDSFVKRNNFAGSRTIERLLARWGVSPSSKELYYSQYIGSAETSMQIGDVMSQGSDVEVLGEYAGKGIIHMNGDEEWNFETDKFGHFFVVAFLQPIVNFTEGIPRELFHTERFAFYHGEYDGVLPMAISTKELFNRLHVGTEENTDMMTLNGFTPDSDFKNSSVYGYVPKYSEYKRGLDRLTGDFTLHSLKTNIEQFALTRKLYDDVTTPTEMVPYDVNAQESNMANVKSIIYQNDALQYDRIFKLTDGSADPFFCIFHFEVDAERRMIPIKDTPQIDGYGDNIQVDSNGTRVS